MYKIRKIQFKNHNVLGDLYIDFCDRNGNASDTIILAGENGVGKSTVLQALFEFASGKLNYEAAVEVSDDQGHVTQLEFYDYDLAEKGRATGNIRVKYNAVDTYPTSDKFKSAFGFSGIFSDVDIVFSGRNISAVTSKTLDARRDSQKSGGDLPQEIKQLMIDIDALDSSELSRAYYQAKEDGKSTDDLQCNRRLLRFTNAFSRIFDDLKFSHIDNVSGHKEIYFTKNGKQIPIDSLSSGEKQIVFRGCFLLKDANAMGGAFAFIDEPEISLHPNWQTRIMDYYKGIFTGDDGKQTSQIFAVTHSPFVIHNDNRRNDKVIVLARNENGEIIVKDKPEYFKCNSIEAVQDAFYIKDFSREQPTVYLEGRTDEKYFNKAVKVYGLTVPFVFKWVGYIDDRGQEANTGEKSVDAAYQFLVAQNLPVRNICLKDCDTNRDPKKKNNAVILAIPPYQNSCGMKKGIENALVLDGIDLTPYYISKVTTGDYAEKKEIQTFDKMACCDGICAMDNDTLKGVFVNLKAMIDRLVNLYNEG